MEDPIVNEVRKYRREILETYGSIRAYHEDIMKKQKQYIDRLVQDGSKYDESNSNRKNAKG